MEKGTSIPIFMRVLCSMIVSVVALIPFWFWLLIKHVAQPEGFWQNLVLAGLGMFFLGMIQLVFFAIGVAVIFVIWE